VSVCLTIVAFTLNFPVESVKVRISAIGGLDGGGLDTGGLDTGGLDTGGLDAVGLDAGRLDAVGSFKTAFLIINSFRTMLQSKLGP
jgi:hypothetical protein